MTVTEVKERIAKMIQDCNDEELLAAVERLLDLSSEQEGVLLTEAQKVALREADKEIDEGNFLTNEEAKRRIDEWLKK